MAAASSDPTAEKGERRRGDSALDGPRVRRTLLTAPGPGPRGDARPAPLLGEVTRALPGLRPAPRASPAPLAGAAPASEPRVSSRGGGEQVKGARGARRRGRPRPSARPSLGDPGEVLVGAPGRAARPPRRVLDLPVVPQ